jgi:hypothetical protein
MFEALHRLGSRDLENDAMDLDQRKAKPFSDEFVIRKAKIHSVHGPGDDRLKLLILPELQNVSPDEYHDLPIYPPFIKGTVITGRDMLNDGHNAEFVWVICTPDLSVGYVLGKSNPFADMNDPARTKFREHSYNYHSIKTFLQNRQALPENFDYHRLMVINWVATEDGGMLNCYNYITGDWVLLNTSGTIITVQQQQIYMRCGTPPNPVESGPAAFSSIRMTPGELEFIAPNITFRNYQKLMLGHGTNNVLGCPAPILVGKNGVSSSINPNIFV